MSEFLLRWFVLMADVSLKVLLLAGVTGLLLTVSRIRNSSLKHAAWLVVLGSLIGLPLLSPVLPAIPIPVPFAGERPGTSLAEVSPETSIEPTPSPLPAPLVSEEVRPLERVVSPPQNREIDSDRLPRHETSIVQARSDASEAITTNVVATAVKTPEPEITDRPAKSILSASIWLRLISLTWCLGVLIRLLRLLVSINVTRRLVQQSMRLEGSELVRNAASSILGTRRLSVTLRESPLTYVPLTTGWWRPSILLPTTWQTWSEDKLGHVLIHELTHVRRGDCWTALLTEVVVCFYWFHPLTWWLKKRLAGLSEECCDDAAIMTTGNRTGYARHLLEIASVLCEQRHRVNYAGLAMTRRSQVETRILTILDPNRPLSQRLTRYTIMLLVAASVPLVVVAAALRPATERSEQSSESSQVSTKSDADAQVAPAETDARPDDQGIRAVSSDGFRVQGRVVDPDGQPMVGVTVSVRRLRLVDRVRTLAARPQELGQVTTNGDGSYEFLIPTDQLPPAYLGHVNHLLDWIQVAATSPGFGIEVKNFSSYEPGRTFDLKLVPDTVVRGRILNLEGRPVAGVEVSLREIFEIRQDLKPGRHELLDRWYASAIKKQGTDIKANREMIERFRTQNGDMTVADLFRDHLRVLPSDLAAVKTDAEGRFELRGIGIDRLAVIELIAPNFARSLVNVITHPIQPVQDVGVSAATSGKVQTFHGTTFDYVLGPSPLVSGIVRDVETKRPLAGALVTTMRVAGDVRLYVPGSIRQSDPDGFISTITDSEGRYRLEGLPPVKGSTIKVFPPASEPYLVTGDIEVPESPSLQPVTIDVELRRAVWATGQVFDRSTNKPVQASIRYSPFWTNPFLKNYPQFTADDFSYGFSNDREHPTDTEGRFRIPVIPGRGVLAATHPEGGFIAGAGIEAIPEFAALTAESRGIEAREITCDDIEPFRHHFVREIEPAADAESFEVNLPLDPGLSLQFSFVDPDGKPVRRVRFHSLGTGNISSITDSDKVTLSGLPPQTPTTLMFRHGRFTGADANRELAKVMTVTPSPNAESVTVQLDPLGKVRGRLVDADGKPWPARWISVTYQTDSGQSFGPFTEGTSFPFPDRSFELELMTGCAYRLIANGEQSVKYRDVIIADNLVLKPGQVTDLGVIKIEAEEPAKTSQTEIKANLPEKVILSQVEAKTAPANDTKSIRVHGRIANRQGQPVADTVVALIGLRKTNDRGAVPESFVDAVTDREGRYELIFRKVSPADYVLDETRLFVRAAGHALASRSIDLDSPESKIDISLEPEQTIRVKLIDAQGQPAAKVFLTYLAITPTEGKADRQAPLDWNFALSPSDSNVAPPVLKSDADGFLTIPYVPVGHGVFLKVVGDEKFAPQQLAFNTELSESRPESDATYRPLVKNFPAGETPLIPLAQAQIFEGVVWLGTSNTPAANVKLSIWSSQQTVGGSMFSLEGQTDANGRFRLNPYPGVRFGITAYPPKGTGYQIRQLNDLKWETGDAARKIEIRLPAGLLAHGTVVDAKTGKPLANASVQYHPDRAHNKTLPPEIVTGWQSIQTTDENGLFEIPVAPGPGTLLVHAPVGTSYILRQITNSEINGNSPAGWRNYAHAFQKIDGPPQPQDSAETLTSLPAMRIAVEPGGTVKAKLVDSDQHVVEDAIYTSRLYILPTNPFWRAFSENTKNGIAIIRGVEQGIKFPVVFLDTKRKIGATAEISLDDPNPTIVLKPCASAKVRYIDPQGKPIQKGLSFGLNMVVTPGESRYTVDTERRGVFNSDEDFSVNFARTGSPDEEKTDANGMVKYDLLVPGTTYRLNNRNSQGKWIVEHEFVARSGEVHDLGDVVVDLKQ